MEDSIHVVCPHCATVNRLPGDRLAQAPKCGRCHGLLFTGHPAELSSAGFRQQVSRSEIPVLVDFWAPWCGPCRMMAPHVVQAAAELEPRVRLVKVNTDDEQALSAELDIRSIPTLALFRGGHEIARQPGVMGTQDIVRWVHSRL